MQPGGKLVGTTSCCPTDVAGTVSHLTLLPSRHRTYFSAGSWHRPQNSHAALLDKYWTKLQMGNMTREELKKVRACSSATTPALCCNRRLWSELCSSILHLQVLVSRYPQLTVVSDRLLDIYCQLTGERHSEPDDSSQQEVSEEKSSAPLEGRALSLRCEQSSFCTRVLSTVAHCALVLFNSD